MTAEHSARESVAPSGVQVRISNGRHDAVIAEVGGGIRSYQVAGEDVLHGYSVNEPCKNAAGQPLIPWPNRLSEGRYQWDGQEFQAPINEVDKWNALHGFTRSHNWNVAANGPHEAVARLRLHPQQGYPFILDLSVAYTLGEGGLTVTNVARNIGTVACPYGHGAHPYISVGTALIDEDTLTVPANTYLPTDERQIPVGREPVEGTPYDFRHGPSLGQVQVDHAFTDLTRDNDGLARVVLSSDSTGRSVTVWLDGSYPYVMIFTGDSLDPVYRRRAVGVEPMTCPPNAFATGEDVLRLEPGKSVTTRWGITPRKG